MRRHAFGVRLSVVVVLLAASGTLVARQGSPVGSLVAGSAVHWFLTPAAHPDASAVRSTLVLVQGAAGIMLFVWAARRAREERWPGGRAPSGPATR